MFVPENFPIPLIKHMHGEYEICMPLIHQYINQVKIVNVANILMTRSDY